MKLHVFVEPFIDRNTDQSIKDGLCICFPEDIEVYSKTRSWNGYDPCLSVVLARKREVVAHAAVIDTEILFGKLKIRVAGIMNVFVLPAYRNRGLAARVMNASIREAAYRDFHLGLLFCKSELEGVYRISGWRTLVNRNITRVVSGRELPMRDNIIAMYYPLRQKEPPSGDIHLQGNEW
jgi:GNAT superfamily N-acetyltransferase